MCFKWTLLQSQNGFDWKCPGFAKLKATGNAHDIEMFGLIDNASNLMSGESEK